MMMAMVMMMMMIMVIKRCVIYARLGLQLGELCKQFTQLTLFTHFHK